MAIELDEQQLYIDQLQEDIRKLMDENEALKKQIGTQQQRMMGMITKNEALFVLEKARFFQLNSTLVDGKVEWQYTFDQIYQAITKSTGEKITVCCGAHDRSIPGPGGTADASYQDQGICPDCKEHTTWINDLEVTLEEATIATKIQS